MFSFSFSFDGKVRLDIFFEKRQKELAKKKKKGKASPSMPKSSPSSSGESSHSDSTPDRRTRRKARRKVLKAFAMRANAFVEIPMRSSTASEEVRCITLQYLSCSVGSG